jgi:hypothetical protein
VLGVLEKREDVSRVEGFVRERELVKHCVWRLELGSNAGRLRDSTAAGTKYIVHQSLTLTSFGDKKRKAERKEKKEEEEEEEDDTS